MTDSSLLENCFSKNNESWRSYFSKWENLAKYEEEIPENELVNIHFQDLQLVKSVKKKTKKKLKKKNTSSNVSRFSRGQRQRYTKTRTNQMNKGLKTNKKMKQPVSLIKNQITSEESKSEELDSSLKPLFTNVLKAFLSDCSFTSVLSKTCNKGVETTFFSSHFFNQQSEKIELFKTCDIARDIKENLCLNSSCKEVQQLYCNRNFVFNGARGIFEFANFNETQMLNRTSTFFSDANQSFTSVPQKMSQIPQLFLNLQCGINSFDCNIGEKCNQYQEKSLQSSFTNLNSLPLSDNKNLSDYTFSENALNNRKTSLADTPKKRKLPLKLSFFENEPESDSDEDHKEYRSPVIKCSQKKRFKTVPDDSLSDSDSDISEYIFDRVKK